MKLEFGESLIKIPVDEVTLEGNLILPPNFKAMVIFAHGSGSSRLSPRNIFVAQVLQKAGFGTLLFDLLTEKEDLIYENRFDIELLAKRLKEVTVWLIDYLKPKKFNIGYFGASTGSAAALIAAAELGKIISAVVSRGGRPDLAKQVLDQVQSPTLLIVGGNDEPVIGLNQTAYAQIKVEKKLKIVPSATHLFEEPGKLEEVARLATNWFKRYLTVPN